MDQNFCEIQATREQLMAAMACAELLRNLAGDHGLRRSYEQIRSAAVVVDRILARHARQAEPSRIPKSGRLPDPDAQMDA